MISNQYFTICNAHVPVPAPFLSDSPSDVDSLLLSEERRPNRGPTRRSTPFASLSGRSAMKPRSAGHLERSVAR